MSKRRIAENTNCHVVGADADQVIVAIIKGHGRIKRIGADVGSCGRQLEHRVLIVDPAFVKVDLNITCGIRAVPCDGVILSFGQELASVGVRNIQMIQ